MDNKTMRADVALVVRGLAQSRQKAQALIKEGLVQINGSKCTKPSLNVTGADTLTLSGALHPYVSRGGLKLAKALTAFNVDPLGMVCMDIGASTGGFTDVLLQNGAKHVFAVDVGEGQLSEVLACDSRVTSMEHTNARTLKASLFPVRPQLAVMDVSFISIKLILPSAFDVLGNEGRMICLVKPQFEAGRSHIGKGGIVSSAEVHLSILSSVDTFISSLGWQIQGLDYSPITGGDGNIEFLADMIPAERCIHHITSADIADTVKTAHDLFSDARRNGKRQISTRVS